MQASRFHAHVFPWLCLSQLVIAIIEATSVFWFFWEPASCVFMDADTWIWFQIRGLILGLRRPSMFSGRERVSIFAPSASSLIVSLRGAFTTSASSPSMTGPVFSFTLRSRAIWPSTGSYFHSARPQPMSCLIPDLQIPRDRWRYHCQR